MPSWDKSALKKSPGRAARAMYDEGSSDRFGTQIQKLFPKGTVATTDEIKDNAELRVATAPVHTAFAKGQANVGFENERLATVRICHQGTRFVILLQRDMLVKYVTEKVGENQDEHHRLVSPASFSFQWLHSWLDDANKEDLEAVAAKVNLFCCTVGPMDALYTPCGFIYYERAINNLDVVGIRMSLVVKSLAAKAELESVPEAEQTKAIKQATPLSVPCAELAVATASPEVAAQAVGVAPTLGVKPATGAAAVLTF